MEAIRSLIRSQSLLKGLSDLVALGCVQRIETATRSAAARVLPILIDVGHQYPRRLDGHLNVVKAGLRQERRQGIRVVEPDRPWHPLPQAHLTEQHVEFAG